MTKVVVQEEQIRVTLQPGIAAGDVTTAVSAEATARDSAIATHSADTTSVHGIADTADLVLDDDSRLTDARTPTGSAGGILSGTYPDPDLDIAGLTAVTSLDDAAELVLAVSGASKKITGENLVSPLQPRVKLATARAFRMSERGSAFAAGVDDTDDVGWFQNGSAWKTSDDNVTLTDQGKPTGATVGSKVVRFGDHVYVDGKESGVVKVYRSIPPSAGTVSWSSALLTTAGTTLMGPCFNKSEWGSDDVLLLAEYGNPSGGPSIWRSADGETWDQVLGPISTINHFHCVAADPYNAGHIYATAGDGDSKVLYRSIDGGDNWTLLISEDDWQAVQISFSEDYVWFAGDGEDITVWVLDRDDATTPIIASSNHHSSIAVPGGTGAAGQFTDGVLTKDSTTLSSASAAFTSQDVGKLLRFAANSVTQILYDNGISIQSVTDAQHVVMSRAARGTSSNISFYIDGDLFFRTAFYGRVDPDTGIYYCVCNAGAGTRAGLFYLPHVGGRLELLETFPASTPGEIHIRDSKLWFHEGIHPLLARAD